MTFIRPANRAVLVYRAPVRATRCSCASPTCRAPRRRPRSICRPGAAACRSRCSGACAFPPHRRGALRHHARALRVLLVPAASTRPTAAGGIQSVPRGVGHPGDAVMTGASPVRGTHPAQLSSATCCPTFLAHAALVRRQGQRAARHDVASRRLPLERRRRLSCWPFVDVVDRTRPGALRRCRSPCSGAGSTASPPARRASCAPVPRGIRAKARWSMQSPIREFVSLLLAQDASRRTIEAARPPHSSSARPGVRRDAGAHVRWAVEAVEREQSNSSMIVDDTFVLKVCAVSAAGIHPEIEMGRFLTDVARYRQRPPLLGSIELIGRTTRCTALAVLHGFVENQGDAWTVTSAYLDRFVDEQRVLAGRRDRCRQRLDVLPASRCARSAGARPSCISRWRAARISRPLRLSRSDAEDVAAWTESSGRPRRGGARRSSPVDVAELDDATRALADVLVPRREEVAGPHSRSAAGRHRGGEDPPARRFPSRPDPDRQGRCVHSRLRRRAAAQSGGTSPQGAGRARRRRACCARSTMPRRPRSNGARQAWPDDHAKFLAALDDWTASRARRS